MSSITFFDESTPESDCPNVANHTPSPRGYMAAVRWAERMRVTHVQQQCPDCGRWAIWEERKDTIDSLTRDALEVGLTFEPLDKNGRYGIVRFNDCDMVHGTLQACRNFIDEWRMAEI